MNNLKNSSYKQRKGEHMGIKIVQGKFMKYIYILLLVVFVTQVFGGHAFAAKREFNVHDGELWSYNGTATDIVIPSNVKVIKSEAFMLNHTAKTVTIPDSVIRIEKNVFNQSRIETITIGSGLQLLSKDAFRQADCLKNIIVSPNNPVYATIDGVLFNKTTKSLIWHPPIKESFDYVVPNGTLRVEDSAFGQLFNSAKGLTNIKLPDSINYLGNPFNNCKKLNSCKLPSNLVYAGGFIDQCGEQDVLNIPASLTHINDISNGYKAINVDSNNKYYKSIDGVLFNKKGNVLIKYPVDSNKNSYTVPNGVVAIADSAFINSNLKQVILPEGLEVISDGAFYGVPLENIKFPNSLKYIGSHSFATKNSYSGGLKVTEVTLPPNLEVVSAATFDNTNVKKIVALNPNTNLNGSCSFPYVFKHDESKTITLLGYSGGILEEQAKHYKIPFSSLGRSKVEKSKEYKSYLDFKVADILKQRVTNITVDKKLDKLIVPKGIPIIRPDMFDGVKNKEGITSIEIPDTVRIIESDTFGKFRNLKSVIIPKSVIYIGKNAFSKLEHAKYIEILNPNVYLDEEFISCIDYLLDANDNRIDIKHTFKGFNGSSTQAYANAYMCKFVSIDASAIDTAKSK
jgi:hypothetical protein